MYVNTLCLTFDRPGRDGLGGQGWLGGSGLVLGHHAVLVFLLGLHLVVLEAAVLSTQYRGTVILRLLKSGNIGLEPRSGSPVIRNVR